MGWSWRGVAGERASARDIPGARQAQDRGSAAWPWVLVAATVAWSLWELRATVAPAQYQDDSSVHAQMVRFATARIAAGHDPLTSWFPYLGLGSPQFAHYQSAPAIVTGLAGLVMGPDAAFRWSLYLLWCLWPVAVYASARVLGLARPAAAAAAVVAPLLHSVPGIGYEQHAYVWAGFGVWTQLWGSWALPFAWALSWRAMTDTRFLAPAGGLVAMTAAFHFETGYLAFGAIPVLALLVRAGLAGRLVRAAALLAVSLLACAWVVVPLLAYSRWAGVNQALAGTPLVNGYGARVTLSWLVTGRLLDDGRLPVVSLLALAGLAVAASRWRGGGPERALVALLAACLALSFGRTTFGPLISIIPGSADLFFRRFLMGAQLSLIYLAGLGAAEAARQGGRLARTGARYLAARGTTWLAWAPAVALTACGVAFLVPAWRDLDAFDAFNSAAIGAQVAAQRADEPQIAAAAAFIRAHGGGRAYAGSPSTWGPSMRVGFVPAYKYLESLDLDQTGYTLRTASLMTQPEYHFDPASPGDYALFGVRYLILPATQRGSPPLQGAILAVRTSLFQLFELPGNSYIRVADTVGSITANRANIGTQALPYLHSALPGQDRYLTVAYAGARPAAPTQPAPAQPSGPAGTVLAERADLADGRASAVVHLRRRAVVVLAVSFDPGWSATVDGRPAAIQMVTPALVAITAPPGTHHITFHYTGFGACPQLLALAALDLLAAATAGCLSRRRRGGHGRQPALPTGASITTCPAAILYDHAVGIELTSVAVTTAAAIILTGAKHGAVAAFRGQPDFAPYIRRAYALVTRQVHRMVADLRSLRSRPPPDRDRQAEQIKGHALGVQYATYGLAMFIEETDGWDKQPHLDGVEQLQLGCAWLIDACDVSATALIKRAADSMRQFRKWLKKPWADLVPSPIQLRREARLTRLTRIADAFGFGDMNRWKHMRWE